MIRKELTLREGRIQDLDEIQKLYVETIKTVCKKDYNSDQIRVWAFGVENTERWKNIFLNQDVIVVVVENQIAGFGTLDEGKYIDMFYVHKDYQGIGVANLLYNSLESRAIKSDAIEITADVSKTARPFFEKKGFVVKCEQKFDLKGVEISNYKMFKKLFNH